MLVNCAGTPLVPYSADSTALPLLSTQLAGIDTVIIDRRARFREIFCAVIEDHGSELPEYMPCEEALTRVGVEPLASGRAVSLDSSGQGYLVGLVPGLAWQCVRAWMNEDNSAPLHVAQYGFDARLFEVDGLSSPENNARQIRDFILALSQEDRQRPLILIGHSKGAVDILQAAVSYPEVRKQLVAVVSIAGAIGGSPLAEKLSQSKADMLTYLPGSGCEKGDSGAIASLYPKTRADWLKNNPLPAGIRYYSVIALPDHQHLSVGLKYNSSKLNEFDTRNDGQLIFSDQFIPGATLMAFANADHWAISTPVARQRAVLQATIANKSKYPREALFESILRFVDEDLAGPAAAPTVN